MGRPYTLQIQPAEPARVPFGAARPRDLDAGWYASTGSAMGSGGLARVDRHYRLAAGDHDARHWHVDSLLGHPASGLVDEVRSPGAHAECAIARTIADATGVEAVAGVGATDCDCGSHLAFAPARDDLESRLWVTHVRARD